MFKHGEFILIVKQTNKLKYDLKNKAVWETLTILSVLPTCSCSSVTMVINRDVSPQYGGLQGNFMNLRKSLRFIRR